MGEISQSLSSFKKSVEPALSNMSGSFTQLQNKIQSVSDSFSPVETEVSNYYTSSNSKVLSNKVDKLKNIYSKIASSVQSDLKGFISDSKVIVDLVSKLEKINEEIDEEKAKISRLNTESETYNTEKSRIYTIISNKNKTFNDTKSEAETKLASLKGKDASLSFVEEFLSTSSYDPKDLQYGTFELKSFTASNGKVIDYWIYIPDYGKDHVDNLPAMLYMHGGGSNSSLTANQAVQYGLSSYIKNKEITPSGIVIVPVIRDFGNQGVAALKELTDYVVEEENIDTNRISVSGHSYGAMTAYKLVNDYPDYFSCMVALSGAGYPSNAFKGLKVWSFNGAYETGEGLTSVYSGQRAVKEINALNSSGEGGYGYLTVIKTGHAGINQVTYEKEYESPDGIKENPLDWAFRQEKTELYQKATANKDKNS